MTVRSIPFVLGVAAFATALAVPIGIVRLELGEPAVILVAVLATLAAASGILARRGAHAETTTPSPERRLRVAVPGRSLRSAVDAVGTDDGRVSGRRRPIADGLRGVATAVLTRIGGLSPESARRRIEDGSWTEDGRAAAFLSESVAPLDRPLVERLRGRLGGGSYRTGVRRTVVAIAAAASCDVADRLPRYDPEDEPAPEVRTSTDRVDGIERRERRSTGRWAGVGALALGAVGVGALAESAAVVLAGAVGVGYAGLARTMAAPTPALAVEREVSEPEPEPGEEVEVCVRVTNEGDRLLPELRIVDGVPAGLAVTDGASRLGTALRPGESATFAYAVRARRGRHEFDPALVTTRDLHRSAEAEFLVGAETTVVVEPRPSPLGSSPPFGSTAATLAGRLTTDDAGEGGQFHSVREYRRSDPLNRIDWNRRAKTGELATLEFHEERAARVLVVVDARESAYRAPEPGEAHAVDRSVDAAGRIAETVLESGDAVGLAAIGPLARPGGRSADGVCWLAPGSGADHRTRLRRLLATHPQLSTVPPEPRGWWLGQLRTIDGRLPVGSRIVLLTPLADRTAVTVARRLDARGHPVGVVSPDPTADRTCAQQLTRVARRLRTRELRRAGIPVVDWHPAESLERAVAGASDGGRR